MGLTKPRAAQIYNLDYKQATQVITIVNIALAGGAPDQVDGINLSINDRVLVIGQSTSSQNGIYIVSSVGTGSNGTWIRTTDANQSGEIGAGMIVMVTKGLTYADTQWKLITNNPITIGVTALEFVQNYNTTTISNGNSNVVVYNNANVAISSANVSNVAVFTATDAYFSGNISATGNVVGGNVNTDGNVRIAGKIVVGAGTGGNLSGANVIFATTLSATGNVYGNYFIGNGSALTGIITSTNSFPLTSGTSNIAAAVSGNIGITVGGAANVMTITNTGVLIVGDISVTGNVYGNNVAINRGADSDNWDTLINMGTYAVNRASWSGTSGTPLDSTVYVGLLTVMTSGATTTQVFYPGTVTAGNVKIQWNRTLYGGFWTAWYMIINDNQVVDAGTF